MQVIKVKRSKNGYILVIYSFANSKNNRIFVASKKLQQNCHEYIV